VRYAERDENRGVVRTGERDRRLFPAVLPPEAEREAARREEHAAGTTRERADALMRPEAQGYRAARGIAPRPAGSPMPEETIRRMRGRLTPEDSDYAQG